MVTPLGSNKENSIYSFENTDSVSKWPKEGDLRSSALCFVGSTPAAIIYHLTANNSAF